MNNKPSLPKGTRDFSPSQMVRRNYIFNAVTQVFKKYGFQQIETPAMENLSTLAGTGGEESDTLIFKIMLRGDKLKKMFTNIWGARKIPQLGINDDSTPVEVWNDRILDDLADEALRYDLTVPFARYVVQNQNDIVFPFRRFQIQPVWRADRPQKGRYREFYQCDVDIIGSDSLLNEVDLIKIIDDVFTDLFQEKLDYTISINNRKILQGIVESVGETDKFEQIVVAIDKLDKIGIDGVVSELFNLGFDEKSGQKLLELIGVKDMSDKMNNLPLDRFDFIKLQLEFIEKSIENTVNGQKGIEELGFVFSKLQNLNIKTANIKFDPTLARGLGYYTGTIIEVKVANFPSICGGGRYDDLTSKFGLKNVSGVGISFGADRIYDVLLDNNLYPEFKGDSTQVLFYNYGEGEEDTCLKYLFQLREAGINAEFYPDTVKQKRQYNFAVKKGVRYVVTIRSNEIASGKLFIKDLETEKSQEITINELITLIKTN